MEKVYLYAWTEYERGWGNRPDGASLHLTIEDGKKFVKDYWDSMPDEVQDEYSAPNQDIPIQVMVSEEVFKTITPNNRLWRSELNDYLTSGDIKI